MPHHKDALDSINKTSSIADKLKALHKATQQHHPFISRISVALYDTNTDLLKTSSIVAKIKRPYKKAWSNEEAYKKLKEMSGIQFDSQCVEALLSNKDEIEAIQRTFMENDYG